MAKECTEPRNMANFQCRNCDEYGHGAKECPKPRDSKSHVPKDRRKIIVLTCTQCRVSSARTARRWATSSPSALTPTLRRPVTPIGATTLLVMPLLATLPLVVTLVAVVVGKRHNQMLDGLPGP